MRSKNKRFYYKNHKKNLKEVARWGKFEVVFYRTNLYIHTQRIKLLIESNLDFLKFHFPNLDVALLFLEAEHHDDPEFYTGDVPLQLKLLMNENERALHKEREFAAVGELIKTYPKTIQGYSYEKILMSSLEKNTIESQIVSFLDKIDGSCEAFHEILAGNNVFIEPLWNYPHKTFNKANLDQSFYLLKDLFDSGHPLFKTEMIIDTRDYFNNGRIGPKPHNEETLKRKVGFYHYELWRDLTIQNLGKDVLLKQKEFFEK